jgi:hypothetical protein
MLPLMASTPPRQYHPNKGGVVTLTNPSFQPSMMVMSAVAGTPTSAAPVLSSVMTKLQNTTRIQQLEAKVTLLTASLEAAAAVAQLNAGIVVKEAEVKLKTMVRYYQSTHHTI